MFFFWPSPLRLDLQGHKILIPLKPCRSFTSWAKPRRKLSRHAAERQRLYDLETDRLVQALVATAEGEVHGGMPERQPEIKRTSCGMDVHLSHLKSPNQGSGTEQRTFHGAAVAGHVGGAGVPWWKGGVEKNGSALTCTISAWVLHGPWLMPPAQRNHLQSVPVVLPSLAPFARNIVQQSFSSPAATWCAGIANVAEQLRQCPMCRGPVSSASNGLFMDWEPRPCCRAVGGGSSLGWKLQAWWLWPSFVGSEGSELNAYLKVACSQLPTCQQWNWLHWSLWTCCLILYWTSKWPTDFVFWILKFGVDICTYVPFKSTSNNYRLVNSAPYGLVVALAERNATFHMTAIKLPMQLEGNWGFMANSTLLSRGLSWWIH